MHKTIKRITSLILVTVLVCLCATSALAVSAEHGPYEGVTVEIELLGGASSATATLRLNGVASTSNATGTIRIDYVYCIEDGIKPSNYQTGYTTKSYSLKSNGSLFSLTTSPIPSGCVLLEATATFTATFNTANATVYYTPDPLTIDLT